MELHTIVAVSGNKIIDGGTYDSEKDAEDTFINIDFEELYNITALSVITNNLETHNNEYYFAGLLLNGITHVKLFNTENEAKKFVVEMIMNNSQIYEIYKGEWLKTRELTIDDLSKLSTREFNEFFHDYIFTIEKNTIIKK